MRLWLRHQIEFFCFNLLLGLVAVLPARANAALGRWFGRTLFRFGMRKKVVLRNLELAFKDKSKKQREEIGLACYQNMGSHLFEFLKMGTILPKDLHHFVELEGAEVLLEALKEDRGVVIAGSHFGHWELLSAAICQGIHPFHGFTGQQTNLMIDRRINQIRDSFGMLGIKKSSNSNKEMLRTLKNKELLGILGDLNVPHKNLFIDFFGIPAAAGAGLGRFVSRSRCPLVFIWITRKNATCHVAHFKRLEYPLTGDSQADTRAITQLYFAQLQTNIEAYPDHYFWFNRRFKTRPESEAGVHLYENMD